jgi:hypothetical protein
MDVAYDITRLPEVIPHLSPVQVPFLPNPTNQVPKPTGGNKASAATAAPSG